MSIRMQKMKEAVLDFIKSIPKRIWNLLGVLSKRMGWWFWAIIGCVVLGIILGMTEEPGEESMSFGESVMLWTLASFTSVVAFAFIWKFFKSIGKVLGFTAKVAGKGAAIAATAAIAAAGAKASAGGGRSSSSNINTDSSSSGRKKEIRKVWHCTYTGCHSAAPAFIEVPSIQAGGNPLAEEMREVLINMGYSPGLAHSICNGASSSDWKFS